MDRKANVKGAKKVNGYFGQTKKIFKTCRRET